MEKTKVGLLDLPPEIRLKIYEYITYNQQSSAKSDLTFYFGNNIVKRANSEFDSSLMMLRTNRLIYKEAAESIQRHVQVNVVIDRTRLENMRLWPFVTNVMLKISLLDSKHHHASNLDRINRFVKVIENGKHLEKLKVNIVNESDKILMNLLSDIVNVLKALRMTGEVTVVWQTPAWLSTVQRKRSWHGQVMCWELEAKIKNIA